MKASAKAPSNIAFIKYWGKKDPKINLPENGSLAVCLDGMGTVTTVDFSDQYEADSVVIDGQTENIELGRVQKHIDLIREMAQINTSVKVISQNSFPHSSGLASSASGFAALSMAGAKAAGLDLDQKQLSILARHGSGSAARSVPDGFVEWYQGKDDQSSYAYSMFPPDYWDLAAVAVLVTKQKKDVSTTTGHSLTSSSPFYQTRLAGIPNRIEQMKQAIKERDIEKFGQILEEEVLSFTAVNLTLNPYVLYLEPATIQVMKLCQKLRDEGLQAYFTFDAGPQPVVYCLGKDVAEIAKRLGQTEGVIQTIVNHPTVGTHLTDEHLF